MLQGGFIHNGMSAGQAHSAGLMILQGMVTKQASVAAFADVFLVTALLCAIGIIPALFIKDATKKSVEEKGITSMLERRAVMLDNS